MVGRCGTDDMDKDREVVCQWISVALFYLFQEYTLDVMRNRPRRKGGSTQRARRHTKPWRVYLRREEL